MFLLMLLAAMLWGVTNPLLKLYSKGIQSTGSALDDIQFLLNRPKYLITQIVNLSGSVVFFYALRDVDVSVGSIVVNSLAFVITVLVSVLVLHEGTLKPQTVVGCLLVMAGTGLCTLSTSPRFK
ncbi:transmembrane protein 234 [Strigomonas culicis]|uniref:Transmembrane protein 234 n=1 Tax=Strigomonas culicis TaxID=28005 RepID=S9VYF8_9TRYP|nr:transmembrane protein 234 [Strigomonas culicis]EPY34764.1 transmembrane protein 234 [Strigomonas culicis]EPY36023.1 transmembrane protein 234 [Strigomonas culicis]|eukprot:EPY32106.1 transmembrane protein 234 [Strigomonas culicis]